MDVITIDQRILKEFEEKHNIAISVQELVIMRFLAYFTVFDDPQINIKRVKRKGKEVDVLKVLPGFIFIEFPFFFDSAHDVTISVQSMIDKGILILEGSEDGNFIVSLSDMKMDLLRF